MTQHPDAITVAHLSVTFGDHQVLDNVSFQLEVGECVALVGPNGGGKSTLLKAICGDINHQGSVALAGLNCHHRSDRSSLSYIPQREHFDISFPILVFQVVLAGRRRFHQLHAFHRRDDIAAARAALARVGLSKHWKTPIAELSGGQLQRVLLARSLAQEANVILLDESFSGVDEVAKEELLALLHDICQQGATVLLVTHDLPMVRERFRRALLLNHQILGDGDPREVLSVARIAEGFLPRSLTHAPQSPGVPRV